MSNFEAGYIGNQPEFNEKSIGVWNLNDLYQRKRNNIWRPSELIFSLDAANYTSGSIWYDSSNQNNNASLVNTTYSSSNDGSFVFNGTNAYAALTNLVVSGVNESTWILFLRLNSNQGDYDGLLYARGTQTIAGMMLRTTNSIAYHYSSFWTTGLYTLSINTWVMVALTIQPTQAIYYVNGVQVASNITSHGVNLTFDNFEIGRDSFGSRLFNGNISIAQFYTRALTSSEILAIFNTYRSRYGL